MPFKYHLVGNPFTFKRRFKRKFILILIIAIIIITTFIYISDNTTLNDGLILVKGESRKDKYGIELNQYILDGIYSIGFDGRKNKKIEDWSLYIPPCPNLHPVHYPEEISNPVCEDSSLQIMNFDDNRGKGLPHSLPLKNITSQLNSWKEWEKENKNNMGPLYAQEYVRNLVTDKYHPFDYGYKGNDTSEISDTEYYNKVINSRMDEVPDPRRRRLFFFFLFNTEFNILDVQLSEYYEIADYFVIYEANSTFSGMPKPLYFTRTLLETNRYDKYKDKLIPLPLEITLDEDNGRGKAFPREIMARRVMIEKGLRAVHARHGDIFIHGDLDEFPKPHALFRMKKCGGWEHLQMGIGGGPKSFKDSDVKSYFVDKDMNVPVNVDGTYMVDYYNQLSIGFMSWFYEYSFHIINNDTVPVTAHPDIAIFDARRSLGQLPERTNSNRKRSEREDPLLDPNFDPYQGYSYTDNSNMQKTGKGFIGEYIRDNTAFNYEHIIDRNKVLIWSGGWHISTFLPTLDLIFNKVRSYSHYDCYKYFPNFVTKMLLKYRISRHAYIFAQFTPLSDCRIRLPESYKEGYKYNFSHKYWKENIENGGKDENFRDNEDVLKHEIPNHVWQNPICYNYMLDREHGLHKKVWWEVVPKKNWNSIQFKDLNEDTINQLLPVNITGTFKKELLESMKN
ncbi:glycosyltransferase family 17 protein [Piromyces sp. E2]|nr:glycosyltransferase family 17 protein [Piromyces sp. E2]|eukprot:OUM59829.1 glycosyltransferase family 17 protein [Piromyces sp. E2]